MIPPNKTIRGIIAIQASSSRSVFFRDNVDNVLLPFMPVYFLSTAIKTWFDGRGQSWLAGWLALFFAISPGDRSRDEARLEGAGGRYLERVLLKAHELRLALFVTDRQTNRPTDRGRHGTGKATPRIRDVRTTHISRTRFHIARFPSKVRGTCRRLLVVSTLARKANTKYVCISDARPQT